MATVSGEQAHNIMNSGASTSSGLDIDPDADVDDKLGAAAISAEKIQGHFDDMSRIWENMDNRRREMCEKEIRLRKITTQLKHENFTQKEINDVFNKHASKELFDDIVKKYNERGIADPDISDIL